MSVQQIHRYEIVRRGDLLHLVEANYRLRLNDGVYYRDPIGEFDLASCGAGDLQGLGWLIEQVEWRERNNGHHAIHINLIPGVKTIHQIRPKVGDKLMSAEWRTALTDEERTFEVIDIIKGKDAENTIYLISFPRNPRTACNGLAKVEEVKGGWR